MGSTSGVDASKKRAMWLYPKVMGFNPSERWGHSACCSDGVVYVFGGCCGGLHFSDVLVLDLKKMVWSSLATTGQRPGTRDSHSAVLIGHRMIVLGGTNGQKKVNDLHILDLRTKEWSRPHCKGDPPSPRESHTATVIGEDRLVIFGGSGEGEGNYLNDVHILDLKTMTWTSPDVKGDLPVPRDSHTAVAIGNQLFVYGGDCGDRYHGEVDVLEMETLIWSRLIVHGSSPGVRAGHAAVNVYIIGGVGDKRYYSDVWVLDVSTCSWSQLDVRGQQPQGRFSHTAIVMDSDIAIYGGCGEDERPLNELLILQLGSHHPNGRYNISMCKIFGSHWNQEKRKFLRGTDNLKKNLASGNGELNQRAHEVEAEMKLSLLSGPDNVHPKRRKTCDAKPWNSGLEQEEHSLSLSQQSSPSQSDQEQNNAHKLTSPASASCQCHMPFKLHHQIHHYRLNNVTDHHLEHRNHHDLHTLHCESGRQVKTEQLLPTVQPGRQGVQFLAADQKPQLRPGAPLLVKPFSTVAKFNQDLLVPAISSPSYHAGILVLFLFLPPNLFPLQIGAEVHGTVDGAFDSGYLMTANIYGQIFRGVLFAPGAGFVVPRPAPVRPPSPTMATPIAIAQLSSSPTHVIPIQLRPLQQPAPSILAESGHRACQVQPPPATKASPAKLNNDLQGLALTLGGSGGGNCGT
ncbi:hypothetical protein Taro_041075 [Colocasia esculenta]|uniref:Uncharacterized protein n=1 Tax=Colocasia esculenta TaxID=4460 RepID=A0A843WEU9_COLES|nr:hypothetical protein [Colocasia esculenta]